MWRCSRARLRSRTSSRSPTSSTQYGLAGIRVAKPSRGLQRAALAGICLALPWFAWQWVWDELFSLRSALGGHRAGSRSRVRAVPLAGNGPFSRSRGSRHDGRSDSSTQDAPVENTPIAVKIEPDNPDRLVAQSKQPHKPRRTAIAALEIAAVPHDIGSRRLDPQVIEQALAQRAREQASSRARRPSATDARILRRERLAPRAQREQFKLPSSVGAHVERPHRGGHCHAARLRS